MGRGDLEAARSALEPAAAVAERVFVGGLLATALADLGLLLLLQGEVDRARAVLTRALSDERKAGYSVAAPDLALGLAGCAAAAHDFADAAVMYGAADAVFAAIDATVEFAARPLRDEHLARLRSELGKAYEGLYIQGRSMVATAAYEHALEYGRRATAALAPAPAPAPD